MKITDIPIPLILPATASRLLVEEFPTCEICKLPIKQESSIGVYRDKVEIRFIVHKLGCITQLRMRLIKLNETQDVSVVCDLLGIERRTFYTLKAAMNG